MELIKLKEKMDYQWKVQMAQQWGCQCVAYIDARDVMDRLDAVCGPENWQDEYYQIQGQVYCKIGILCPLLETAGWVWKSDCGTPAGANNQHATDEIKFKGQASDAFKRAAVKWGIGRFLYDMDFVWLPSIKDQRGKFNPMHDQSRFGSCDRRLLKQDGLTIRNINQYIKSVLGK